MHLAQMVEVKGDISLESVQVYSGAGSIALPGAMGFAPPMGGGMGFAPSMGGNMGFAPPPTQPPFGGDFGSGFGFPSAPPSSFVPPFAVRTPASHLSLA